MAVDLPGLTAAYFLRRNGHAVTHLRGQQEQLGGMMRYGIPGYRTPREMLDAEINRIIDLGVEVKLSCKIGCDVAMADLQRDYDAVFLGVGAQSGSPLPIPGADAAPNCISGIAFLDAFNDGRLHHGAERVLVIGGGDTAMDVAAVARRLGHIQTVHDKDRPEYVVLGQTAHDVAHVAKRDGAEVVIVYRRPVEKMPAAKQEIEHVLAEGVEIRSSLAPVSVVRGDDGRAIALRVVKVDWIDGKMSVQEGSEFDIECDLIVAAIGQTCDFTGMEDFDNGRGLMNADSFMRSPVREGVFIGGDVVKPHLLTTAIGHASIAAQSIDDFLNGIERNRQPKVNVHHFNLLAELRGRDLAPDDYDEGETRGTDTGHFAIHNYEDRSHREIVPSSDLFLGHFNIEPRVKRSEIEIGPDDVLGHFSERINTLDEENCRTEAGRCMCCGVCYECDNCVIYCPQDAVHRVKKDQRAVGRYVDTDYFKCIGCHICMDVCPSGYIQMGLGE